MKEWRVSALVMVIVMAFTVFCTPASAATHANSMDQTRYNQIRQEVLSEFENDEQFKMQTQEYGQAYSDKMVDQITEARCKKATSISINATNEGDAFVYRTTPIQQITGYYCGPASLLQALYSMYKEGYVSGSTFGEKQTTLANAMGTTESLGTYVYRMVNQLNSYASGYRYLYVGDYSSADISSRLWSSLAMDKPGIIRCDTKYLPYYNGRQYFHYITITGVNSGSFSPTSSYYYDLEDSHYNGSYFGYHSVNRDSLYDSVMYYDSYKPTVNPSYIIYAE